MKKLLLLPLLTLLMGCNSTITNSGSGNNWVQVKENEALGVYINSQTISYYSINYDYLAYQVSKEPYFYVKVKTKAKNSGNETIDVFGGTGVSYVVWGQK